MKFKALTLLLLSVLALNIACQKEEEPIPPIPYFDVNLAITPYPANGASNLSFQTIPILAFNKQVDYEYYDFQNSKYVKLVFDSTYIVNSNNQKVSATPTFNSRKDTLKFISTEGFTANSIYTIKFHYHIEAKRKQTDKFEVLQQDGAPFAGKFESSFGIKDYNFSIDTSNVEYAYPWPYQYHFLKDETNEGVLLLKNNQELDQYFKNATFKVRFYSPTGLICENNVTYNPADRKYKFLIPTESFENRTIYKVEFKMIDNKSKEETIFLTYHFRTSKFNSFAEKIGSITNINHYQSMYSSGSGSYFLFNTFDTDEPFDLAEGKEYKGLVQFDISIDTQNPYMINEFLWFYNGLKTSQFKIKRASDPVKVPPVNDIVLIKTFLSPLLNKDQINNNNSQDFSNISQQLNWYIHISFREDWRQIYKDIINTSNLNQWEQEVKNRQSPSFYGDCKEYKFSINYIVDSKITSSDIWHCYSI